MKSLITIATLALATALVGCNNNKQDTAAPGAVSGECCGSCAGDSAAAPGAVSAESCSSAESCASSCSDAAAPGAVSSDECGAASSGCSESSAASSCPFSGQAG